MSWKSTLGPRVSRLGLRAVELELRVDELERKAFLADAYPRVFTRQESELDLLRKENAKLAERGDSFSLAADQAERELKELRAQIKDAVNDRDYVKECQARQVKVIRDLDRQHNAALDEVDAVRKGNQELKRDIESLKEDLARERNKLIQVRDVANSKLITPYVAERLLDILDD